MEVEVNEEKARLLAKVAAFTPSETVFEVGKRESESAIIMKKRRKTVDERQKRVSKAEAEKSTASGMEKAPVKELPAPQLPSKNFKDPSFYLDHTQRGAEAEKGYSLKSGVESLSGAITDMTADEGTGPKAQKASQLSWDRKKHKFIKKNGSADGEKMIKSESGALLPASYSSGKYQEWKSKRRHMPDGPVEALALGGGRRGRHGPPGQKRKAEDGDGGEDAGGKGRKDQGKSKGTGKGKDDFKQKSPGKPGKKGIKQSSGLKSAMDIRKQREIAQKVRCTATCDILNFANGSLYHREKRRTLENPKSSESNFSSIYLCRTGVRLWTHVYIIHLGVRNTGLVMSPIVL